MFFNFHDFPEENDRLFPSTILLTPNLIVPFISHWGNTLQGGTNYTNFWPSISYFIPPHVYSIFVKIWGGGGGGGTG